MTPPRLGIYKSWHSFKSWEKRKLEIESRLLSNRNELDFYATTGDCFIRPNPYGIGQQEPRWRLLFNELHGGALLSCARYTIHAYHLRECRSDLACANRFIGTAILVDHASLELSIASFGWRRDGRMTLVMQCPWVALMITCNHDGERMGRLLLAAYKRRRFFDDMYYPLFHMILRVIADWLDVRDTPWTAIAFSEPIMNAVAENWREPGPDKLAPILLNACDYHTHRCRGKQFIEFNNREFEHLPVEILMIFRLRESLGLANPVLDHPLMNTPLGKLPTLPLPECDDPLYLAVLARMESQGFNPDKIYEAASNAPMPPT